MKVWLDDERLMPEDFDIHVKTPLQAINLLETNLVTLISLDHDLGLNDPSDNGYKVAKWIEEKAFLGELKPLQCRCHSANPTGRDYINLALSNAKKFWNNQR